MNNLKIGTLVMLNSPVAHEFIPEAPHNGATGEIIDSAPWAATLEIGYVGVMFPRHPAPSEHGWKCPSEWLIPISGPDIDIDNAEEYTKGDIVHVGETV